jgi:hypothetical protein
MGQAVPGGAAFFVRKRRTSLSYPRAFDQMLTNRHEPISGEAMSARSAVSKRAVVLAGVAAIEIVMAVVLIPSTDHARIETTDFLNFYVGATIVREGQGRSLYQAETQQLVLKSILGHRVTEYYLHPPFEALAFLPLSYLRIERAFVIWTLLNTALLGTLPLLFAEYVSFISRKPYLGLLGFAFPPVIASLTLGQDSILVLFCISVAYLLGEKRRDFAAGLVLSLATVKFQIVLILALLLLFARKYRLVGGFVAGCAFLSLASVLVTPGMIEYFRFVRRFDLHNGYGNVNPASMMNWRGLMAGIGWENHLRLLSAIGSAMLIALGIICSGWIRVTKNHDLGFSLYLAIALAASPYNYFQDAAILLLSIFLVMDLVVKRRFIGVRSKLAVSCCVLMFVWPVILLIFGGHYFWNSRIYLVFPVIVCFIAVLAAELYSQNAVLSVPKLQCG